MSPADQPSVQKAPRSSDPPTLWLSLVLGSVLIHLVLFILGALALTRTATVQLNREPIAVEFVDPNTVTAQSTALSQPLAARSDVPSTSTSAATQAQPNVAQSLPSAVNAPDEQPFVQPTQRRRLPIRTQQPQPQPSRNPVLPSSEPVTPPSSDPANRPTQPPLNSTRNPFPRSPFPQAPLPQSQRSPVPGPTQPPASSSQEVPPGTLPNPSGSSDLPPTGSPPPVEGERISQGPQGESVIVNVTNASQPPVDASTQPAQPIDRQKNVSVRYASVLAKQTINLQATLIIDQNGQVLSVEKAKLLSSSLGSTIDNETLHELAEQIFRQWQFSPAKDTSADGKLLVPQVSNLIIDVQVQLP